MKNLLVCTVVAFLTGFQAVSAQTPATPPQALTYEMAQQVIDAADGVVDLLTRCPDLRVLATSREALRIRGERLFAVPPLSLPERSVKTTSASVLAEYVMDPIGASHTWRWYGYDNSWIVLDGAAVQSVSGGGHWGGGMFISAYDQARFGLLTLRRGVWGGRRILSERWVQMSLTPTPAQTDYGFMNWFLNTGRKRLPSAPESAFMHLGNGTNMIYVDAEHDLVIVARWIDGASLDGLVSRVLAAID